jgi:photosystem II stability/assembly factor-like uncharacterized protein
MKLRNLIFGFIVIFSSLSNSQWVKITNGLPNFIVSSGIEAIDNFAFVNVVWIDTPSANYYSDFFRTTDYGLSWGKLNSFLSNVFVNDISVIDEYHYWIATTDYKILATSDGGITWDEQFYEPTLTDFINYIEMFDLDNGIVMADALADSLPPVFLKTTDGGDNWISVNDSVIGHISCNEWRDIDFVDQNNGYFYSCLASQTVFKTTNGGYNWNETNYSGPIDVLKFYDENYGIAGNHKVFVTTDGGITWNDYQTPANRWGSDFEFLPGNPDKIWFLDYEKLLFSSDSGKTWIEQPMPTETLEGRDMIFVDDHHGWIASDNGIYFTEHGNQVMGIKDQKFVLPDKFELKQNYPNPFNPSTKIQYQVVGNFYVYLKIYDVLGNEVETLVNEEKPAGVYEVEFDGSNLSSGIYFYQLKAGNFVETRKMILLR